MRSHHARAMAPPDPPVPHGRPIGEELEQFLLHEAAYVTATCTDDYSTCGACHRSIGYGETIARPDPCHPDAERICWHCLIGVLLTRAAVEPDDPDLPTLYLNGRARLIMATLRADRRFDRALNRL